MALKSGLVTSPAKNKKPVLYSVIYIIFGIELHERFWEIFACKCVNDDDDDDDDDDSWI